MLGLMTSKELENIMTRDEFDPQQTDMNFTMTGKYTINVQ